MPKSITLGTGTSQPGDVVLCLAVRDDASLVGPYPADYLKDHSQAVMK